jgi:uroporphyrinogen-III synthase
MSFQSARIALLEARMSGEMADLMRRAGGRELLSVPAVREVARSSCEPQVRNFIDRLAAGSLSTVIFFTGVGATTLFNEAEQLGRQAELFAALQKTTVACRGPKPSAVLRRAGIPIALSAREPYTSTELLEALETLDLAGTDVGVVYYGEYNTVFAEEMRTRGAHLLELCLYEWLLPEDTSGLHNLVQEIIAQHVDAVVFTSQIQVRHLFDIASQLELSPQLTSALNTRTVVASVGPTCTGVLQSYGVTPHVVPEHPKMGHLVKALAEYLG